MKVILNLSKKDIPYIMQLALAGCSELLEYPELCNLKNMDWEAKTNISQRDLTWYDQATLVHALAYKGCSKILDYPQYFKTKNKFGKTPIHLLIESMIPRYREEEGISLTSENIRVLNKILKIKGLEDLKYYRFGEYYITPLHYIGELGHTPLLDYLGVEKIESPEILAEGTPLTLLYRYATNNLDKLLRHPNILTQYEGQGSPLESLSYNKVLRPTVKILKQYNFKINKKWHPSKKLDNEDVEDMLSVPKSIRFLMN